MNLQTELADTENRIAERRHAYNQTVNAYRNLVRSIPSNIVADIQDMPERAFFDAPDDEVAKVPKVELYMKKLIIPVALLAMACLHRRGDGRSTACGWRTTRTDRVELADQELAKHEARLVKVAGRFRRTSRQKWMRNQETTPPPGSLTARHEAYDNLVASFQRTMSAKIDPTNPTNRKFMDDVAGAINRRQIAEKQFDAEWQAYQEFLNSRRGRVASAFSAHEALPQ